MFKRQRSPTPTDGEQEKNALSQSSDEEKEAREAEQRVAYVLNKFDEYLDPFEYAYSPQRGIPMRVSTNLIYGAEITPEEYILIDEAYAAWHHFFDRFAGGLSDEEWEVGGRLPPDWKNRRTELESHWPMRKLLMSYVEERLNFHSWMQRVDLSWNENVRQTLKL